MSDLLKTDGFGYGESFAENYASALTVFSLVPYLGIVFCFPAIVLGVVSAFKRNGHKDVRFSLVCLKAGLAIMAIQFVLWSLLYLAPTFSR